MRVGLLFTVVPCVYYFRKLSRRVVRVSPTRLGMLLCESLLRPIVPVENRVVKYNLKDERITQAESGPL